MSQNDYEPCHYCGEWYFVPVAYYHSEEECLENQRQEQESKETIG